MEKKERVTGTKEVRQLGDEKMSLSSCVVAEVTRGSEAGEAAGGGGGEG